jgi:hypothetical protein
MSAARMTYRTACDTQGTAKGELQAASITNGATRVCGHVGRLLLICISGTATLAAMLFNVKLESVARIGSAASCTIHLPLQHLIFIRRDVTCLRGEFSDSFGIGLRGSLPDKQKGPFLRAHVRHVYLLDLLD